MTLAWARVRRRLPAVPWYAPAVGGYFALVALVAWLGRRVGCSAELCLFKRLTGLPCPTCGTTRGALLILGGRPLEGFLCNPLVFAVAAAAVLVVVVRLAAGRAVRIRLSRRERIALWWTFAALAAANWLYVILYVH